MEKFRQKLQLAIFFTKNVKKSLRILTKNSHITNSSLLIIPLQTSGDLEAQNARLRVSWNIDKVPKSSKLAKQFRKKIIGNLADLTKKSMSQIHVFSTTSCKKFWCTGVARGGRLFWFRVILTKTCHFPSLRPLLIEQPWVSKLPCRPAWTKLSVSSLAGT